MFVCYKHKMLIHLYLKYIKTKTNIYNVLIINEIIIEIIKFKLNFIILLYHFFFYITITY